MATPRVERGMWDTAQVCCFCGDGRGSPRADKSGSGVGALRAMRACFFARGCARLLTRRWCSPVAVIAIYNYDAAQEGDLSFEKGDSIVVESKDGDWWTGTCEGRRGIFPSNYVKPLARLSTAADIQEVKQDPRVQGANDAPVRYTLSDRMAHYWHTEGPKAVFIVIWLVANVGLFLSKMVAYIPRIEDDEDIASVFGWSGVVARGTGEMLKLNCSIILVPVLRNLLCWIRAMPLAEYLPLDKNIVFHKYIGIVAGFLGIIHSICHYVNLVRLARSDYSKMVRIGLMDDNLEGDAAVPPNIYFWSYVTIPGWTGHLLLIVMLLLHGATFRKLRHSNFEVFWYSHHLFVVYFGLLIGHGMQAILEAAGYWKWFVGPGTLYLLERIIRYTRAKQTTVIEKVRMHPSGVIELQMNK